MMRSVFGWDLPPGVSMRDIDPPSQPCELCGVDCDVCNCPECPVCQSVGDPECYESHGLVLTLAQRAIRDNVREIARLEALNEQRYWEALERDTSEYMGASPIR